MQLKDLFKKTEYVSQVDPNLTEPVRPKGKAVPVRGSAVRRMAAGEQVTPFCKCPGCSQLQYVQDVTEGLSVCPSCGYHFRLGAPERLSVTMDPDSFEEWDAEVASVNVLDFPGYSEKLEMLRKKTGMLSAVQTGVGTIGGYKTAIAVMDSRFMMGSMGQAVGEKITRAIERATKEKLPIIIFTASGGARMQEGILSLMQMAKTSAALKRHDEAGQLYITVLTDPTTGGVTASFAMLGDIILAEPKALIGFAGRRVIEQTIKEKIPKEFQTAEFQLEHGFVDEIVPRSQMRETLRTLLMLHGAEQVEGGVKHE